MSQFKQSDGKFHGYLYDVPRGCRKPIASVPERSAVTLPPAVMRVLRTRFGVTRLRPGQAEVLASVLKARDTIAILPTGSGKSLCFQLPALMREGLTVVVSPLIALMQDQAEKLGQLDLAPAVLNSAVGDAALDTLARRDERILLTTPEQLEDRDVLDALRHAWRCSSWMKRIAFPSGAMIFVPPISACETRRPRCPGPQYWP